MHGGLLRQEVNKMRKGAREKNILQRTPRKSPEKGLNCLLIYVHIQRNCLLLGEKQPENIKKNNAQCSQRAKPCFLFHRPDQ